MYILGFGGFKERSCDLFQEQFIFVFSDCGGDISGLSGIITSPNYPESFPAFTDCIWRIKVPADRYISFRFEEFKAIDGTNPECSADSVEVREGYSKKAQVIGN